MFSVFAISLFQLLVLILQKVVTLFGYMIAIYVTFEHSALFLENEALLIHLPAVL